MAYSKDDYKMLIQYFHEIPKKAPAYVALVLFFLGGLVGLLLVIKSKAKFMYLVPVTAWLEVAGFACRLIMLASPSRNTFIAMQCFLIITPVLLPLINYIVVGRLMMLGNPDHLPFRPQWVARIFTTSDVFCLFLQGGGGGLISSDNPKSVDMGTNLILAGLFLQLFFFTGFTFLTLFVQFSKKFAVMQRAHVPRKIFICLYVTITMLYIRNIFRCVEFIMGYAGYLASHEAFFYVFDFAMICSCVFVYDALHSGFYLPKGTIATTVSDFHRDTEMATGNGPSELVTVKPSSSPRDSNVCSA